MLKYEKVFSLEANTLVFIIHVWHFSQIAKHLHMTVFNVG